VSFYEIETPRIMKQIMYDRIYLTNQWWRRWRW